MIGSLRAHGPATSTGEPWNDAVSLARIACAQLQRLLAQVGALEPARRHEQGARRVHVGVGRRLGVRDLAVPPQEREQPVGAPDVVLGPAPDRVEAVLVADGGRDQHAVRLALADRVAALVDALDAAVLGHVGVEEGRWRRRRPCRRLRTTTCSRSSRSRIGIAAAAADREIERRRPQRQRQQQDGQLTHRAAQAATSASSGAPESGDARLRRAPASTRSSGSRRGRRRSRRC